MRIVIAQNPAAGGGRASDAADEAARVLRSQGHDVDICATQPPKDQPPLDERLENRELLVVCGGDGAMRLGAEAALKCGTAVYHLPFGTENLFAREFGMTRDVQQLAAAVNVGRWRNVDVGRANGELFLLMVSIGLDAEVVHDLTAVRRGAITHWSYVWPIARQVRRWKPAQFRIRAEGHSSTMPVAVEGRGIVVIANSSQYGWRLDPVRWARIDDGLLDGAVMAANSRLDVLRWVLKCRWGRHEHDKRLSRIAGRVIVIEADRPLRYQLDGDAGGVNAGESSPLNGVGRLWSLRIEVQPGVLRVLCP